MDGRPTFFLYTVFAMDRWFSRVDTLKSRCQSLSLNTESVFQNSDRARRGRPAQELIAAWRACSASVSTSRVRAPVEGQRLATRSFTRHFTLPSSSSTRARRPGRRSSHRAKSSNTERLGLIHPSHSTTVSFSTSVTPPPFHFRLR